MSPLAGQGKYQSCLKGSGLIRGRQLRILSKVSMSEGRGEGRGGTWGARRGVGSRGGGGGEHKDNNLTN